MDYICLIFIFQAVYTPLRLIETILRVHTWLTLRCVLNRVFMNANPVFSVLQ